MSDRSPPIPLIAAALLGGGLLLGVGVAMMSGGQPGQGTSLATQPAPGGALPTQGAPSQAAPAPRKVEGPQRVEGPATSADEEPYALRMARRMLKEKEEAAALDLIEAYLEDEGPDQAALRLREAVVARCDDLIETMRGTLGALKASGHYAQGQADIASLRRRLPGSWSRALDELAQELGAPPAADLAQARGLYESRRSKLEGSPSAEGYYELALWARERGLTDESNHCLLRTVKLDAFHERARKLLGHKKHEGRWYSDDEYKAQVLGLVRDPNGRWVKPAPVAKAPEGATKKAKPKLVEVPKPEPQKTGEDTEWYKDTAAKISEWEDAKVYKSKYYLIRTNVKQLYARRYMKMMDQYFKRFITVFKNFLPETKYERSEIYIHASKAEFHEKNPQVPKTAGGFYQPKTKRVVAYHGIFGKQGTTRTVLAHEGTHQFEDIVLRGKFWNCPIWMLEGLAVFFESAIYKNGKVQIGLIPRERLYSLKRGLANNALIPLRTLIRTPQRQFSGYHYAHAWALIYMVVYGDDQKKERQEKQKWFSDLFMDALKGKVAPNHVERKIGGKAAFDKLEQQWKEWVKELPYDFDPKKR
ncbi:MAG TPA: hypothetical protein DEA08_03025 [Planctomycetes bacterium]|nr:hypothetical protein [Planctomycetota bacterium]